MNTPSLAQKPGEQLGVTALQASRGYLEIAWQRKNLIALWVVAALVVGVLYWAQATRVYQAKAQVLVIKKRPDNVTGLDTRNLVIEDYVATHQALIKSPLIIDRAIKRHNLDQLKCLART